MTLALNISSSSGMSAEPGPEGVTTLVIPILLAPSPDGEPTWNYFISASDPVSSTKASQ